MLQHNEHYATDMTSQSSYLWMDYTRCINFVNDSFDLIYMVVFKQVLHEWGMFPRFGNTFVFMSICQIYNHILVHMPCSKVLISRYVSHYLYQKAWSWLQSYKISCRRTRTDYCRSHDIMILNEV